ncbi:Galactose-binding domain-like protein [Cynara cardunculus var. scolymus]|uniref:Galactose-binding domain-like protein n=1 Tax=Cynara cardunculus var. scolymus TaxID=59895 RepID=A0A103Y1Y7_CYNCS|nr:Galactose-binding domain-like protein [Cynara cardunculus var. scolymus]
MECCYNPITNTPFSSFKSHNRQSVSSSLGTRFSRSRLSSGLSNPFLKVNDRVKSITHHHNTYGLSTYKRTIYAESRNQGWDFGRFVKTFLIANLSGPSSSEPEKSMDSSGIVLVAGATGGVGRRVVDILRKKGLPVRVLVRNEEKARKMLGPDVDLKVINAVSVIVGPKEGDTPDRAKYSQGIKFFEPEIKGASPEMVEYIGMQNLIKGLKDSVGLKNGKLVFGFTDGSSRDLPWGALDDVVMGGVSESSFQIVPNGSENGGPTENLSAYDGLELRLNGDGRRYKLIIRTSRDWDTVGYTIGFDTAKDQWQSVRVPFSSLRPIFRAKTVANAVPFDPTSLNTMGNLIRPLLKVPFSFLFVHVGSAGVTRPERPGLDLSKQPPAVRLNKELGSILTFKLKGEDLIRESGIPYAIVRPCALTEEPAGADLIFDQGDNITGKISREEVAKICVAALESPNACDKTFEVKCVVPFSEQYTIDPENPPPEKDYDEYFKSLKDGITGKEILEKTPLAIHASIPNSSCEADRKIDHIVRKIHIHPYWAI